MREEPAHVARLLGSNRTFMELKSYKTFVARFCKPSSNRTFMELKFIFSEDNIVVAPF